MSRRNGEQPKDWPGTGQQRAIEHKYPTSTFDATIADWMTWGLQWCEEHVRDARRRRTLRAIIAHIPMFIKEGDSLPDGSPLAQFSVRQISDASDVSPSTAQLALDAACTAGGPLRRIWKPRRGDSSMGAAYTLSVPGTQHSVPGTQRSVPGTQHSVPGTQHSVPGSTRSENDTEGCVPAPGTQAVSDTEGFVPVPTSTRNGTGTTFSFSNSNHGGGALYAPRPATVIDTGSIITEDELISLPKEISQGGTHGL